MSRRRIRRNRKHVKVVLAGALCLLMVMTAGYAAFSTNININAKGNIKDSRAQFGGITVSLVESGDGLYSNGDGSFTYKGADPDNYINFNGETWRIVSIDSQGIKIIREEKIDLTGYSGVNATDSTICSFDTTGLRDSSSNGAGGTYCSQGQYGCNAWAATSHLVGTPATFVNGNKSGTVLLDAALNTWLNGTYYTNTLGANQNIITGTFNVGNYENESEYQWQGHVALLTRGEYRAGALDSTAPNYMNNNYLKKSYQWWNLSPFTNFTYSVCNVSSTGAIGYYAAYYNGTSYNYGVRPVLYLSNNIQLSGSGTSANPYTFPGSGGSSGGGGQIVPTCTFSPTIAGKKVIVIGDRDGLPGEAIVAAVESAGGDVIYNSTEAPAGSSSGNLDPGSQTRIKNMIETYGNENCIIIIGASEGVFASTWAETVIMGDPTFSGSLAGVSLYANVYHILEADIKSQIDPDVWADQIETMEMLMDVEDITDEMENNGRGSCSLP